MARKNDYWDKMRLNPRNKTKKAVLKRKEAYEKAHEIRKFEIELFWQRATYYWAFILAAFTAHFAIIGMIFAKDGKDLSIPELYKLPGLSLFALALTAFFCYFFSFCWVLMNKGSKFWQKNWEAHIDELENEFSGDLYKVILDTNNKNEFYDFPLSTKAYDFSVSKITMITSMILAFVSLCLFCFYMFLIISRFLRGVDVDFKTLESIRWGVGIVFLIVIFLKSFYIVNATRGNPRSVTDDKWFKREMHKQ